MAGIVPNSTTGSTTVALSPEERKKKARIEMFRQCIFPQIKSDFESRSRTAVHGDMAKREKVITIFNEVIDQYESSPILNWSEWIVTAGKEFIKTKTGVHSDKAYLEILLKKVSEFSDEKSNTTKADKYKEMFFKTMYSDKKNLRVCGLPSCSESETPDAPREGSGQCIKCKLTWYCSRDHQGKHWKTHKPECARVAAKVVTSSSFRFQGGAGTPTVTASRASSTAAAASSASSTSSSSAGAGSQSASQT